MACRVESTLIWAVVTISLVLLGLMGNWQNWLSKWSRWWNISDQSQPDLTIRPDGPPCSKVKIILKISQIVPGAVVLPRREAPSRVRRPLVRKLWLPRRLLHLLLDVRRSRARRRAVNGDVVSQRG